ncbi:MAG: CDP-alcohol phosphatidyltransferase [Betaproteobacteria bacterium]|nr:CDP-alcohol phosphatidyltransferase [Betaproteobacteria bacterium]
MSRRTPSVAEVVAAYRPKFAHEVRTEWAIALVYRPFSFVLTPLFAACGASPTAVTMLALACALSLPWLAVTAGESAWAWVGALGFVFCILDCVDGDLARVTARESKFGAYADFLTDTIYRIALYGSIGLMVGRSQTAQAFIPPGEGAGLAAGLACALLAIVARACRLYVEAEGSSAAPLSPRAIDTSTSVAVAFISGIDHLLPIGVLAFGAAGRLDWLLAYLFAYSLGDLVLTQAAAWRRLR